MDEAIATQTLLAATISISRDAKIHSVSMAAGSLELRGDVPLVMGSRGSPGSTKHLRSTPKASSNKANTRKERTVQTGPVKLKAYPPQFRLPRGRVGRLIAFEEFSIYWSPDANDLI